jgi:hypothetical protein
VGPTLHPEDEVVTARCQPDRLSLDDSNLDDGDDATRPGFWERAGQRIQFQQQRRRAALRGVLDELDSAAREHFVRRQC